MAIAVPPIEPHPATMRLIRIFPILLLIFAIQSPTALRAQWTIVEPNLISVDEGHSPGGAISFSDGIVWAGHHNLFSSSDSGLTWNRVSLNYDEPSDYIYDIQFLDKNNGIVTTYNGIFLTTNGGASWKNLQKVNFSPGSSGSFGANPNTMVVSLSAPGTVYVSTNGGQSFTTQTLNQLGREVLYHQGSFYFFTAVDRGLPATGGTLYRSNDGGTSWQKLNGSFDQDCYSFSFDSCSRTGYIVNEAAESAEDEKSQILTSKDGGDSWQSSFSQDLPYFSGALALGNQSAFVPTVNNGVFRTIDHGSIWNSIGGPGCTIDQNSICAINDNLLLVLDSNGNVWRTTNAGGNPVVDLYIPPSVSSTELFNGVTASTCGSATAEVSISPASGSLYSRVQCSLPTILSQWIEGQDEMYYAISHASATDLTKPDSIVVLFQPNSSRDFHATLKVQLTDGTLWQIALGGHGTDSEIVMLTSQNLVTNVIGDSLGVQVQIENPGGSGFALPISYDTTVLVYQGTYDTRGNRLDTATLANGSAIIRVVGEGGLAVDTSSVFARFAFYPKAQSCGSVTFGPGRFVPDTIACGSIKATTVQICSGDSCGRSTLSDYLRFNRAPLFRIAPNPASTLMEITSSAPVSAATIEVLNALGRVELRETADLNGDAFVTNLAGLTPGPKFVRILSKRAEQVLPVLILR